MHISLIKRTSQAVSISYIHTYLLTYVCALVHIYKKQKNRLPDFKTGILPRVNQDQSNQVVQSKIFRSEL
jgi:hypothetical protein